MGPIWNEANNTVYTHVLLENAEVMAVGAFDNSGDFREENSPEYDSVTMQAPTAAVEAFLALEVQALEDLTLVLRNPCEAAQTCDSVGQ